MDRRGVSGVLLVPVAGVCLLLGAGGTASLFFLPGAPAGMFLFVWLPLLLSGGAVLAVAVRQRRRAGGGPAPDSPDPRRER